MILSYVCLYVCMYYCVLLFPCIIMMCSIFMLSATYAYHNDTLSCVCVNIIRTYMRYIHVYYIYIYICTCIHTLQKKKRFFHLNIKDNQSVHLVYIKVNTGNDRLKPFSVAGSLFVTLIEIYSFSSYPYIYAYTYIYIYIHVYTYITTLHNIIYVSQLITLNMKKQKHT